MNVKPLLIVNSVVIAGMAAVSAWAWQAIPGDAQIPVHWNILGEVDRYGSKMEVLLLGPAIAIFVTAIMWFLPRTDPRRANLESSAKLWNAVTIGVVALLAYIHVLLLLTALGRHFDMVDYLLPALAALFVVIGNYLPKTRSNWFAGVRTPWSMSSDYSWTMTHRLGGRLFVGTGVVTIVAWLVAGKVVATIVLIATLLSTVVISIVASYAYWKNDPDRPASTVNGQA
jgi:uncharacterized membrane protein